MAVQNITKIALVWELYRGGVPQAHIVREIGVDRVAVYRRVIGNQTDRGPWSLLRRLYRREEGSSKEAERSVGCLPALLTGQAGGEAGVWAD